MKAQRPIPVRLQGAVPWLPFLILSAFPVEIAGQEQARLLPAIVDPGVIFGQNTAFYSPDDFHDSSLSELLERCQITGGKTPCAFFGASASLAPAEALTINTILGHVGSLDRLQQEHRRLLSDAAIQDKRREAHQLAVQLTDNIATKTSSPLFDTYCRQTRGRLPP